MGITVTGAPTAKLLCVSAPLRESKSDPTHAPRLPERVGAMHAFGSRMTNEMVT